jgi:hypothetical protein
LEDAKALSAAGEEHENKEVQQDKPEVGRHQDQSDDRRTFAGTTRFGPERKTQGHYCHEATAQKGPEE